MVKAGALGVVKEVHVWTNRPIWPHGMDRPKMAEKVPAYLSWDLWLGPSPERPFHHGPVNPKNPKRGTYHNFSWRGWWDFGSGALGDMACHTMNLPFQALDLRDPIEVEAESSGHNKDSFPKWSIIRYTFAATDKRPAIKLVWYDGGKRPSQELFGDDKVSIGIAGSLMIGDKGKMYSTGDNGAAYQLLGGASEPSVEYVKSPGHFTEWVQAIKKGGQAMSNFPDYAGPLTETVLLGNLAVYAGKKIEWNAKEMKAKNVPEVAELIKPTYRKGWTL
jgi:predicted dehydrogenase